MSDTHPMSMFRALLDKTQSNDIADALARLQLNGSVSKFQDGKLNLTTFGGRGGYTLPMNEGSLSFGLQGGGAVGNYDGMKINDKQITGGDLAYQNGDNRFSLSHTKMGGPMPVYTPQHLRSENFNDPIGRDALLKHFTQLRWDRSF